MTGKRDDWVKSRSQAQHLTEAEVAEIKQAYLAGYRNEYIARKLECSSRTVAKYYALFHAEGAKAAKAKPVAQDRFYRSNFEL